MDQSRAVALQDGENPALSSGQKDIRETSAATAVIALTMRAHWFSSWFLFWAARPYMVLDSVEHRMRWGHQVKADVAPGRHKIGGGIRYHGIASLLGVQAVEFDVAAGEVVRFVARNGVMNSTPFKITGVD